MVATDAAEVVPAAAEVDMHLMNLHNKEYNKHLELILELYKKQLVKGFLEEWVHHDFLVVE